MSEADDLRLERAAQNLRACLAARAAGLGRAANFAYVDPNDLSLVLAAAESTLPKTTTVGYWYVEWAFKDGAGAWRPIIGAILPTRKEAEAWTHSASVSDPKYGNRCIRVTGPHLHEVPRAD